MQPIQPWNKVRSFALTSAVALATAVGFAGSVHAADEAKPADVAAPQAKAAEPTISEEAKTVIDKVRDSYTKLEAMEASGSWSADFDVNGQKQNRNGPFTSQFQAPNKFKYESKDDLSFGSTGDQIYVFAPQGKQYLMQTAPKRSSGEDLPQPFGSIMRQKDPALLLALTTDPKAVINDATKVDKVEDVKLDDKSYTALAIATESQGDVRVLVDPETNLLRQMSIDMKGMLEKNGQKNVNKAQMVLDYKAVKTGGDAKPGDFAWAPPEGAKDMAKRNAEAEDPAAQLRGKPAPDFSLASLEGKKVSVKDLKGHVAILDFWATWCGPCRAGLPHLDKLYQANKEKGLIAYAVNLKEEKNQVQDFVKETKLGVPVLLDTEGDIAEKYLVSGIPHTVVIGKDGKVADIIVGFGGEGDHRLKEAVEKAMK